MRFGEYLHVSYDIEATNFRIPALCLQPVVENAVKHGVGAKEEGGTVSIASREKPECFEITVTDDGVGFDSAAVPRHDKTHIGIRSVEERLRLLIGARLEIQSEPGRGTRVYITIPKEQGEMTVS